MASFSCTRTACPFTCPFSLRGRQLFAMSEASDWKHPCLVFLSKCGSRVPVMSSLEWTTLSSAGAAAISQNYSRALGASAQPEASGAVTFGLPKFPLHCSSGTVPVISSRTASKCLQRAFQLPPKFIPEMDAFLKGHLSRAAVRRTPAWNRNC